MRRENMVLLQMGNYGSELDQNKGKELTVKFVGVSASCMQHHYNYI